jgi:hypothetical protein
MYSLVGSAPLAARRKPRQDVFYGAGAEHPMASLVGFGEAPPMRGKQAGARAADERVGTEKGLAGAGENWVRCHVCAQMFGHPAILVHEPQCHAKWRKRAMREPPSRRLPPPARPDCAGLDIVAYNEAAQAASDLSSLRPCPQCGRKLPEDKYTLHVRTCEEEPEGVYPPPPIGPAAGLPTRSRVPWIYPFSGWLDPCTRGCNFAQTPYALPCA